MLAELDCAAVPTTLKSIRTPLDAMVVPCAHAEAMEAELRAIVPHEACECLVLAWHHALMRPSRKSGTGQITQATFNLIMLYQNHRRSKSGTRQGKAPMARLTGTP